MSKEFENRGQNEILLVGEETYQKLKEELKNLRYTFFRIKSETVAEIMNEDDQREAEGKERRLEVDGVDPSESM